MCFFFEDVDLLINRLIQFPKYRNVDVVFNNLLISLSINIYKFYTHSFTLVFCYCYAAGFCHDVPSCHVLGYISRGGLPLPSPRFMISQTIQQDILAIIEENIPNREIQL